MKKTTFVAFLLLLVFPAFGSELHKAIQSLETEWATTYYQNNESQQRTAYLELLRKADSLAKQFPGAPEPKIWQAIILSSNAALQTPFAALTSLEQAKELLEAAIQQDPKALDGSAYVTLGTLYYMVPSWPISFGNSERAEELLRAAIQINPRGIDSNYFYADFLLTHDRESEAVPYLNNALRAPVRKQQILADTQLQNEARLALSNTEDRKLSHGKDKLLSMLASASNSQLK